MHRSKGKWVVSNKDTWYVGNLLSPVILAYLTKFRQVAENAMGVPMYYVEKQAEIQGLTMGQYWKDCDLVDLEAARKLRLADIEELMYIFNEENDPDIGEYDFKMTWVPTSEDGLTGNFSCDNVGQQDRYIADKRAWGERQKAGFKLFGEIYQTLDD